MATALAGRLRSLIQRNRLEEHFRFAGLVPPEEIPGYLAAMDIVVHTSLREGLARVLPQALIAGKPVISFDIDGAREVVIPNETGILLPSTDPAELCRAICTLAADPNLRERLGQGGRARFADAFRHEQMTAQLHALYERLLGQASGNSPR